MVCEYDGLALVGNALNTIDHEGQSCTKKIAEKRDSSAAVTSSHVPSISPSS